MKKFLAVAAMIVLAACSNGTISGPTTSEETQPVVQSPGVEVATPIVDPVTVAPSDSVECYVGNGGSFYVRTKGGVVRQYAAYTTSFDDQGTPIDVIGPVTRAPGGVFEGSFNTTCRQVDVAGEVGGRPICFGYINHLGQKVKAQQIDRAACKPPTTTPCRGEQCEPSPEPTPTPSPEPTPTPSPEPTPTPSPEPTPTPTPSPEPTPTPTPSPEPTPAPICAYNVPGSDGQALCINQPGFVSWNEQNHLCSLTFPGLCHVDFNLNGGQSVDGCLKYTGGDTNCNGVNDNKE